MLLCCFFLSFIMFFKNPGHVIANLEYVVDVVASVKRHYRSGCLAILHSPTTEINVVIPMLMTLLSERGIAAASPDISHLNITRDDILCRHNHPLYVISEDVTAELLTLANRMSLAGPTWLLITKSSLQVEKLLANIYIPFNCAFLVAREELQGVFSITEVYQVNRTQPLLGQRIATWSFQEGAKWHYRGMNERRQNLYGHTINVITYNSPPVVTPVNIGNDLRVFGMFGRIWSILAEELNFTTRIHLQKNGLTGGALAEVISGHEDVVLGDVTMTSQRSFRVDFSVPLILDRLCMFIRRPASSYKALNNIVAPFSISLWFTVIGSIFGLAMCLYLAYRIGLHYGSAERPNLYTAPQAILYVLGIFCQQGHDVTPVTWSCRIVYWISYLTAIVLFSAYSGALVSSLANQRIVPPFTTFRGILQHRNYKVATVGDSSHLTTFQDATEDVLRSIYDNLFDKNNMPPTILDGLKNVCSKPYYAFITSFGTAMALSPNLTCGIMGLKKASLPENIALATAKDFPYLRLINFKLMSLQRSGILNRIKSDEWPHKFPVEKSLWNSVSIEAVQPIFTVLSMGIVLGIILVLLENQARCILRRIWGKTPAKGRRKRSQTDYQIKRNYYIAKQNIFIEKTMWA